MVSLMLGLAFAESPPEEPGGAWVTVAGGRHAPALNRDLISDVGVIQLEAGARLGPLELGGQLRTNSLNVLHFDLQRDRLGSPMMPGDGRVAGLGVVVRVPLDLGQTLTLSPRVAAGASLWSSPMEPEAYERDVLSDAFGGQEPAAGLRQVGGFGGAGLDFGLRVHTHGSLFLGLRVEATYTGLLMAGA